MITKSDLNWWRGLAKDLDWQFATTYADGAPHEYVIPEKTAGFSQEDCVRAARVIRTFGEPMKFYKATNIYLALDDGWKYFPLDRDVRQTSIINRGRVEHIYGPQNQPRTGPRVDSPYDPLASEWDSTFGMTDDEKAGSAELIREVFGTKLRRTLDIGCGTGLPLDLGLAEPVRYVGIDPSSAMLNELVWKHKHLAGVLPMTYSAAERRRVLCGSTFDTVLALGGAASYLSPADLTGLRARAKSKVFLMHFSSESDSPTQDLDTRLAARSFATATKFAERQERLGRFVVTVVSCYAAAHTCP